MQNTPIYWGAIATVTASLIAALIALLSLVISKEQKVSEFRQNWIDSLREEIATVATRLNAIRSYVIWNQTAKSDSFDKTIEHFIELNSAITKIRLRLNQSEIKSRNLTTLLMRLDNSYSNGIPLMTPTEFGKLEEEFVNACREVLKDEWTRVKIGEPIYRNTVFTLKCAIGFGCFAIIMLLANYGRTFA